MKHVKIGIKKLDPATDGFQEAEWVQNNWRDFVDDYNLSYFQIFVADENDNYVQGLKASDFTVHFLKRSATPGKFADISPVALQDDNKPINNPLDHPTSIAIFKSTILLRAWQLIGFKRKELGNVVDIEEAEQTLWFEIILNSPTANISGNGLFYMESDNSIIYHQGQL